MDNEDLEWALETLQIVVMDIGSGERRRIPYEDADEALKIVENAILRRGMEDD